MSNSVERAQVVVDEYDRAITHLNQALDALKTVDLVFKDRGERNGLHSISDEIGALKILRSSVVVRLQPWDGYLEARKRTK